MDHRIFVDADGEMLIIPHEGELHIFTELGRMDVAPGSIGVIPRGVRFRMTWIRTVAAMSLKIMGPC